MNEPQAQSVVLVRAIEETDVDGRVLPLSARDDATRRAAGPADGDPESPRRAVAETVIRRAGILLDELERRVPGLGGILRTTRLGRGLWAVAVIAGLVVGLSTNALGPDRRINLLALPLLGLLGWNLAVYGLTLVAAFVGRPPTGLGGATARLVVAATGRWLKRLAHGSGIVVDALGRFVLRWQSLTSNLLVSRTRVALHLGAMAVVAGAVAGMYVRGVAFEYRATWESTLFDAGTVQRLLGLVLGPAAGLLDVPIPDVAPLRGPAGSGDAAIWIHLYAVTGILFVVLPRTLLAAVDGWRCRRLASAIPVDLADGYYLRVSSALRGGSRGVEVAPYSYRPGAETVDRVKTLLLDLFGARADVRFREPLEYGDGAGQLASDEPAAPTNLVLLFNLAQSPEAEVHGALLREVTAGMSGSGGRLLVLIDGTPYRERVASPERSEERMSAWARVVGETGVRTVRFEPDGRVGDDLLAEANEALWTAAGAGSVAD